jgi:hypothetical protein
MKMSNGVAVEEYLDSEPMVDQRCVFDTYDFVGTVEWDAAGNPIFPNIEARDKTCIASDSEPHKGLWRSFIWTPENGWDVNRFTYTSSPSVQVTGDVTADRIFGGDLEQLFLEMLNIACRQLDSDQTNTLELGGNKYQLYRV